MSNEETKPTSSTTNPEDTSTGLSADPPVTTSSVAATVVRSSTGAVGPSLGALGALTAGMDIEPTVGEAALARIAHLLETTVDEDALPRINTSVRSAGITALGACPRIIAMRADAVRRIPTHDLVYLDFFEDILLALLHTDTAVLMSTEEKKELTMQAEVLYGKRDQYSSLAHGFVRFGLMDPQPLAIVGKEGGYKALARDISILVAAFRHNWAKVGKGVPFTLQDLAQLDREATELNVAIGLKEQSPEAPREVNLLRRRVYALFRKAVEDLRRLAIYLYGEDAVDDIIPGFSNFSKGSRGAKGEEEVATTSETPAAATTPGAAAPSAQERPSGFKVNNPENLPITDPFISETDEEKKESA
jgi:hypothetical protein